MKISLQLTSAKHQGQETEVKWVELWHPKPIQLLRNKLLHCPGASLPSSIPAKVSGTLASHEKEKNEIDVFILYCFSQLGVFFSFLLNASIICL
jgi:hypothetical protein